MRMEHTYFEKIRSGKIASTATFGMVTLEFPAVVPMKAKGVHGSSVVNSDLYFLPGIDKVRYEAYEVTAKFGYKGDRGTGVRAMMSFINFLTGRDDDAYGIAMNIYNAHTDQTLKNVRFLSFTPELMYRGSSEDIFTANISLRVMNPNVVDGLQDDFTVNTDEKKYDALLYIRDVWNICTMDGSKSFSLSDFGVYVTDAPFLPGLKSVNLYTNNWPDEDGEQIFDHGRLSFEATDFSLKVVSESAGNILSVISALRSYEGHPHLKIVDMRSGVTYIGAYLSSSSQDKFMITTLSDKTVEATLTFRIIEIEKW